jgi:FtsP/CotA-like multicopper oxidase with cupredoxin domain
MTARAASAQLAPPDYPRTRIWGYDGTMPGPLLRVPQGGRVHRRFVNELPQASSVHWHGIRIDNRMDGVPGLTQAAVGPGESFDYDFAVPDAGTYWYHAHNRSMEQVARGLYGALVVEEGEGPDIDRDEVLVLDDWRLDPETAQLAADFEAPHDLSHAGRRGNFIAANGRFDHSIDVRRNQRLRLRLINAANARIFKLALLGLKGWTVAVDGMPLDKPRKVADTFLLAPGERVDLLVDVIADAGDTAHLLWVEAGEGYALTAFPVVGEARRSRRQTPAPLPPNPNMGLPDLAKARPLQLGMEGGAMGQLEAADFEGEGRSFRQLVEANQFWAFNGTVGMTDTPFAELSLGEAARLEISNDTAFAHAMHLHGMHFREIEASGYLGPMRDTLTIFRGETREIAFVADNPGDWLLHCHMLSHAASGMMTWLRVS